MLDVGFIREAYYSDWLANVVVVLKKGAKWVCIDFTDLNKACPKDSFPLLCINQIVDATFAHKMSFMDVFSGYNYIPMYPPHSKKTTFITPFGIFFVII